VSPGAGSAAAVSTDSVASAGAVDEPAAPVEPVSAESVAAPESAADVKVCFSESDVEVLSCGSETLLEVAEVNGVDLSYGCRMGACGVCKVKLVSGEIEVSDCDLEEDVDVDGMVHACVSRPTADVVIEA